MKNCKLIITPENKKSHINPEIYGHFSEHLGRCIYNGIFVGKSSDIPNTDGIRNDIIEAFKNIKLPVLRWPGGCFADEYHWKDGIGNNRKKMINTNWGGVVEDNSFGTHEFMELCELVGCEPYITGNVGSGTVQEMAEWVEYMTFDGVSPMTELRKANGHEKPWKLKYFGIGNESWGCGGNMRPEYYADEYRRYQSFCKNYSSNELFKIACGPNSNDFNWTDTLLSLVNSYQTKAISLHYYTIPTGDWSKKGSATEFSDNEYYKTISSTMYIEKLITQHSAIMDKHDPDKNIGLIVDEWGCWYDVEKGTNPGFLYQQNAMRDAIVAGVNLNIFNEHSDRVIMANIAQVVNVLQAIILTEGEKLVLTPTYHVFDLYKYHQGNDLVESFITNTECGCDDISIPAVSKSVSMSSDGKMVITLTNCSLTDGYEVDISTGSFAVKNAQARILSGNAHDYNDFENGENVKINDFSEIKLSQNGVVAEIPPCSVVSIILSDK